MSDKRIQQNFVVLCRDLKVDQLLPYLRQERMLTDDEYEQLLDQRFSARGKREKLLLILPRKGRNHFEVFSKCLVWSGQRELAKSIGVDMDTVPPCLYAAPQIDDDRVTVNTQLMSSLGNGQLSLPGAYPNLVNRNVAVQQECGTPLQFLHSTATLPSPHPQPTSGSSFGTVPNTTPSPSLPPPPSLSSPSFGSSTPKSVFLLYCKGPEGYPPTREDILHLADLLRLTGINSVCDAYLEGEPPDNWGMWTASQIKSSDHTLLICTEYFLKLCTQTPEPFLVDMHCGKFFALDVVYHINVSKRVIPVFLNQQAINKAWIPDCLKIASHYDLQVRCLMNEVEEQLPVGEESSAQALKWLLDSGKYEGVASLLSRLLGKPRSSCPQVSPEQLSLQQSVAQEAGSSHIPETTLSNIAEHLPRDWQRLGIKLGVRYAALETLHQNNLRDTRKAAMEMLRLWQAENRGGTRNALKDGLVSLGFGRLAKEEFPDLFSS